VSVSSEPSEFGLPINESELMDDIIMGRKHCGVPKTLYQLRQMFLQRNGLNVEEIFRRQIDEENLVLLRRQFDQRQSLDQLTAEQLSMLIKLWFRELPDRLFDDAAVGESKPINQLILECDSEEKALQIYNNPELCRPACRQVLDWILDLLHEVVQNRDQNRMTSKKIAIVMAPNLLPSQPEQLNAELMRKKADFINYLLSTRGTK
jgi:hypothetical protein